MALTEAEKKAEKKEKPLTKVVIRRLPPTMTKEQFLDQVSPLPDYNYMYHVKSDMSLGENAFSRAYFNFVCPEDVYVFKEKFDNYTFVDSRGHEYPAVVEFAPFQKIPKRRGKNKMDPKSNTIEQDTYYMEFVANLNKPVEQDAKPEYTLQLGDRDEDKKKDMSTPLLEYIKNRRAQKQRIREARREERERRKKEYERKKEEYKGKYEEKPKTFKKPQSKSPRGEKPEKEALTDNADEKSSKGSKEKKDDEPNNAAKSSDFKPKKVEEKKERKEIKPRFPKKEYPKKQDPSQKVKFDEPKKEDSKKKVKKYSERREERKLEAKRAEQKKLEQANKDESVVDKEPDTKADKAEVSEEKPPVKKQSSFEKKDKSRSDNGSSSSRRIRNKDRPALAIYRPGMLRKKNTNDGTEEQEKSEEDTKKEEKKVEAEVD